MEFSDWLNSDDSIGHYTSIENAYEIIKSQKLRFSFLKSMLDPSERVLSSRSFGEHSNSRENVRRLHEHPEVLFPLEEELRKYNSSTQIACFCQTKTHTEVFQGSIRPCFNNQRMWEQYGSAYLGACLIFSKKAILNSMRDKQVLFEAGSIIYKSNLHSRFEKLQISIDEYFESADIDKITNNAKRRFDNILLEKDIDYSSEKEFRIIVHSDEQQHIDTANALIGLAVFKEYDRSQIEQLIKMSMRLLGIEESSELFSSYMNSYEERIKDRHVRLIHLAKTKDLGIIRLYSNEYGLRWYLPEEWKRLRDSLKSIN